MTLFGQALALSDKFREPYHYVAYAYALSLSGDHKTSKEVLAKPVFLFAIIAASVLLLSSCSKGKLVGTLLVHFNEPVKEEVTVYIYPYVSANPEKQSYTIDRISIKKREFDAEFILNAGDYVVDVAGYGYRATQVHVGLKVSL